MRATTLTVSSSRSRECVQVGNPFSWAHAARILPLESWGLEKSVEDAKFAVKGISVGVAIAGFSCFIPVLLYVFG